MDRRIDILDKALDLMAREGAHGTSMRAVAAAADWGRPRHDIRLR